MAQLAIRRDSEPEDSGSGSNLGIGFLEILQKQAPMIRWGHCTSVATVGVGFVRSRLGTSRYSTNDTVCTGILHFSKGLAHYSALFPAWEDL